jgi:4-deoxy-L-threo-5-hexosulose-uronate ketol-isomerase
MLEGASNDDLCDRHLVSDIFVPGELRLTYSHGERFVIGGVVPAGAPLELPVQLEPPSAAGHPFLERRELGVVNIGEGEGWVTVDEERITLAKCEALYVPMGSNVVRFEGDGARFYLLSVAARRPSPLRKLTLADANPMGKGSLETSNERTIYQLVLPGICESASPCLGLTKLKPGLVWNTMPPHIHERPSEVYLYFDLPEQERLFHSWAARTNFGTS